MKVWADPYFLHSLDYARLHYSIMMAVALLFI